MKDLAVIKGIGPKSLELLNRLNVYSVNDLLTYYPFRYNFLKLTDILDDNAVINVKVGSVPIVYRIKKTLNKMSFTAIYNDININVVIFNRMFLKTHLNSGREVTLVGKYDKIKNTFIASDIKLFKLNRELIEPVYHLVSGISNKNLNNYINSAMNIYSDEIIDDFPAIYKDKYKLMDKKLAIDIIHNPRDLKLLELSKRRLKYEELFDFTLKMNYVKLNTLKSSGVNKEFSNEKLDNFIKSLPFELTSDQLKSVSDINDDLKSNRRMNRLLQGDVGSGKTIVAFLAVYMNHLASFQSALMVPTEVLATQHYNNALKLFGNNLNIVLLTSSTKKKEKEKIIKELKEGNIDFIIGTHSLLNDEILFNRLGLIITDEQHRFGVYQRSVLKNKSESIDTLYLSATPIPRTYAHVIYGDLDISVIKSKPKGRIDIKTYLKKSSSLNEVSNLMLEELKKGHQVYVIAPLVEESENSNMIDVMKLYERINKTFGVKYNVDILHGKMKSSEKENVLLKFKNNETKILVSTTIIEVGVDVPNATLMVIFDAHRFGLATLHQLRGRVGRSDKESYCIMVSNYETERLKVMTETTDGFKISEEDFKIRGHGDLFGIRQSGEMNFKVANLKEDYEILIRAKEDSLEYLNKNGITPYVLRCVKEIEKLD